SWHLPVALGRQPVEPGKGVRSSPVAVVRRREAEVALELVVLRRREPVAEAGQMEPVVLVELEARVPSAHWRPHRCLLQASPAG
ncbi:MAG: hypothetical protein ACR2RV_25520, partial [Verrucomicrobiales bacterium]